MSKILYLVFLFFCFPLSASCQAEAMETEMYVQKSISSHEFNPYEIGFAFKYNILKRLYVKCDYERSIALFKIDGAKDYYTNDMYGAKIGYTFLSIPDLSVSAVCGIGDNLRKKNNWDYSYYDTGLYAYIGHSNIKPCLGIILRKYDSHNNCFHDYTKVLFSLGFNVKI